MRLARGDFADVEEALGWAVRMLDAELKGASMVKVEVSQTEVMAADGTWADQWDASVFGLIAEEDRDPWLKPDA